MLESERRCRPAATVGRSRRSTQSEVARREADGVRAGWQSPFRCSSLARWRSSRLSGSFRVVGVFAVYSQGLPDHERAGQPRVPLRVDRLRPHRHGRAGPLQRRRASRAGHLRADPADPDRRRHLDRGSLVLDQHRRRPDRHRVGHARHAARPRARRVDDHPAARPPAPARPRARARPGPRDRAQDQGDHPVGPRDRGLSRARKASNRSWPPT